MQGLTPVETETLVSDHARVSETLPGQDATRPRQGVTVRTGIGLGNDVAMGTATTEKTGMIVATKTTTGAVTGTMIETATATVTITTEGMVETGTIMAVAPEIAMQTATSTKTPDGGEMTVEETNGWLLGETGKHVSEYGIDSKIVTGRGPLAATIGTRGIVVALDAIGGWVAVTTMPRTARTDGTETRTVKQSRHGWRPTSRRVPAVAFLVVKVLTGNWMVSRHGRRG